MELPHGKPCETYNDDECDEVESDQRCDFFSRYGFCSASCGDIGIMFWSRWYMTHIEPVSVTTTRVRVKARAMNVQPPVQAALLPDPVVPFPKPLTISASLSLF